MDRKKCGCVSRACQIAGGLLGLLVIGSLVEFAMIACVRELDITHFGEMTCSVKVPVRYVRSRDKVSRQWIVETADHGSFAMSCNRKSGVIQFFSYRSSQFFLMVFFVCYETSPEDIPPALREMIQRQIDSKENKDSLKQ